MKTAQEFLAALNHLPPSSRQKVAEAIVAESCMADMPDLLTDREVAAIFRLSMATMRRHLREGPPRERARNVTDLRLIKHINVGGSRRWFRESVMAVLNGDDE